MSQNMFTNSNWNSSGSTLFQGSLYLREGDGRSWHQVFVVLKDGGMVVHRGEQVGLPAEILIPITTRELRCFDPSTGTIGKLLHSRAVRVETKPQAACTLRQPLQRRTEYIFAATDAQQHLALLGHLHSLVGTTRSSNSTTSSSNSSSRGICSIVSTVTSPSPAVMARLCCPGRQCSKQLLQLIKAARNAFVQGERGLGDAEDGARIAQERMMGLFQLLDQVLVALKESHPAAMQSDADASALTDCKAWVSSLQALVMEVDMHLASLRVRFSQVASAGSQDWPDLARHTVLQLRDIEALLQAGQAAAVSARVGSFTAVLSSSRPCMPYKSHWAHKIAM